MYYIIDCTVCKFGLAELALRPSELKNCFSYS